MVQIALNSEFDGWIFVSKKNKAFDDKFPSIKLEIRKDKPCFYPGDPTPYDGAAYDMNVCLSPYQILTKKHSVADVKSKVVGLFAHEMRHIYGARHDKEGEQLCEAEQTTFEALAKQVDLDNGYANINHVTEPGEQAESSLDNLAAEYSAKSANARIMGVGLTIGDLGRYQDALNNIILTYPAVSNLSRLKVMSVYVRMATLFSHDSGDKEAESMNRKIFGNKKSLSLGEYYRGRNKLETPDDSQFTVDDLAEVANVTVFNGMVLNDVEKQQEITQIAKDFSAILNQINFELATFATQLSLK